MTHGQETGASFRASFYTFMHWQAIFEQYMTSTHIIIETCLKTCASLFSVCYQLKISGRIKFIAKKLEA